MIVSPDQGGYPMYDQILIPITVRSFNREINPACVAELKRLVLDRPNAAFKLLYIFEPRDCRWLAAGLPNLDPDCLLNMAAHQLTIIEQLLEDAGIQKITHQLAVGNQYLAISQLIQEEKFTLVVEPWQPKWRHRFWQHFIHPKQKITNNLLILNVQ